MRKRYNNCSHGMSARSIYSVFAAATAVMAVIVRAEEQLDLVGPPGAFEEAVDLMMAMNEGMTRDVAEMLVAADALEDGDGVDDGPESSCSKLRSALEAMDDLQRDAAELFDQSYDDYLDLYPLWRMYVLCEDPALREKLFNEYRSLLERYEVNRQELIQNLSFLMSLEQALMPSNAYADPSDRIPATMNTAEILKDFDAVLLADDENDGKVTLSST